MDELVRVFHGGMVKETGEFENMVEDIELFDRSSIVKRFGRPGGFQTFMWN